MKLILQFTLLISSTLGKQSTAILEQLLQSFPTDIESKQRFNALPEWAWLAVQSWWSDWFGNGSVETRCVGRKM